jgi:hypothetical protein
MVRLRSSTDPEYCISRPRRTYRIASKFLKVTTEAQNVLDNSLEVERGTNALFKLSQQDEDAVMVILRKRFIRNV